MTPAEKRRAALEYLRQNPIDKLPPLPPRDELKGILFGTDEHART